MTTMIQSNGAQNETTKNNTAAIDPLAKCGICGASSPEGGLHPQATNEGQPLGQLCIPCMKKMQQFRASASPIPKTAPVPTTEELVNKIAGVISKHLYLPDYRLPTLVAVWILGSHLYDLFPYYGYLWITGPGKRCGKSTLLSILNELCHNTSGVQVSPTGPVLFRLTHQGQTLILDEVESLRKRDSQTAGIISDLLNSGFVKGGKIFRCEELKGRYSDEPRAWNTYSPKALAGINDLPETVADRSFKIEMRRTIRPMQPFHPEEAKAYLNSLKSQLSAWASSKRQMIINAGGYQPPYNAETEWNIFEGCDDRLRDIGESLITIGNWADKETRMILLGVLVDMSERRAEDEREWDPFTAVWDMADWFLGNSKDVDVVCSDFTKELTQTGVSRSYKQLSKYGLRTTRKMVGREQKRVYHITREMIQANKR